MTAFGYSKEHDIKSLSTTTQLKKRFHAHFKPCTNYKTKIPY